MTKSGTAPEEEKKTVAWSQLQDSASEGNQEQQHGVDEGDGLSQLTSNGQGGGISGNGNSMATLRTDELHAQHHQSSTIDQRANHQDDDPSAFNILTMFVNTGRPGRTMFGDPFFTPSTRQTSTAFALPPVSPMHSLIPSPSGTHANHAVHLQNPKPLENQIIEFVSSPTTDNEDSSKERETSVLKELAEIEGKKRLEDEDKHNVGEHGSLSKRQRSEGRKSLENIATNGSSDGRSGPSPSPSNSTRHETSFSTGVPPRMPVFGFTSPSGITSTNDGTDNALFGGSSSTHGENSYKSSYKRDNDEVSGEDEQPSKRRCVATEKTSQKPKKKMSLALYRESRS